jgi:glycerate kinase
VSYFSTAIIEMAAIFGKMSVLKTTALKCEYEEGELITQLIDEA